jgi:hypothetical protein
MSNPFLTLTQFCTVARVEKINLRQMRATGRLALAYGRDAPVAVGRFRPLDLIAFALTEATAPACGSKIAARIIREYWDIWLDGVRLCEWQPRSDGA